MSQHTPSRREVVEDRPHTPVSALSQAFPPDIHDTTATLPLDLSGAGTPVGSTLTPARPVFDPHSPFVVRRLETPSNMFPPASVDNRMRARLFGQGMDGGFLVSPMTEGIHSTVKRHMAHSSLSHPIPTEPRIYDECNDDPFGEESMQNLGWNRQPLSTPATEDTPMFEAGVGLGVSLTDAHSSRVASPVKISTPSKYPSSLGTGMAPPLRKRPGLQKYSTETTALDSATSQPSASVSAAPVQHTHIPGAPSMVQYVTYTQPVGSGHQIANVKAPLTLSQVPRRARADRTAMARSLSMNNASDGTAVSAFTHKPLNRLLSRNISTSSLASVSTTAGDIVEQSPHQFPIGAGKTIYTERKAQTLDASTDPVQPHSAPSIGLSLEQQQQRSIITYSQSSRNALDTPALDYSLASPAFSTYAHSPWLTTPGIGHESATFAPGALQISQEPHPIPTGLAIQVPPGSQPAGAPTLWQGPVRDFSDGNQGQLMHSQGIRIITPIYGEFNHLGHYPYPHPTMFAPSPSMPYMSFQSQPPMYWGVNPGNTGDTGDAQPAVPTIVTNSSDNGRHVSTPFASTSSGDGTVHVGSGAAPMARSMSHGYVPVFHHNPPGFPYNTGAYPLAATAVTSSFPLPGKEAAATPLLAHQDVNSAIVAPLCSIGEETEGSQSGTSKTGRARYPAIGKRLRPGPRPKQKKTDGSPTGLSTQDDHVTSSSDSSKQLAVTSKPKVEQVLPDRATRRSTSPLKEVSAAVARRHHPYEGASTLSKEFLESCYSCFMMVEAGAGPAPCKRYRCNIDNCGRIFPRKSAIHSHVQTHLEDKPYVCTEPDW